MKRLLAFLPVLALGACTPQALYFHETTKVAFAASYNTADSQPLSSTFGFKRRIVAVVPAQDRVIVNGSERRVDQRERGAVDRLAISCACGAFQRRRGDHE